MTVAGGCAGRYLSTTTTNNQVRTKIGDFSSCIQISGHANVRTEKGFGLSVRVGGTCDDRQCKAGPEKHRGLDVLAECQKLLLLDFLAEEPLTIG